MPARAANWEKDIIANGVSMRTRRTGGAYTGPGSGRDAPEAGAPGPPPIGFMGGIPAPNCLPADALLAASERVLRTQGQAALQYGGDQGFLGLREWLAEHWSGRGSKLTADNFCLTNGSGGALANVCETFLNEGDVALVESPTFSGSIRVLGSLGCTIETTPLDDEGLDIDALAEKLREIERRGQRAKFLYVIPSYQNPTGTCLSLERRHRLIELCERYDVLVVEDDAYGELGYEDDTPPSLSAVSGGRGVIKAGSFSKIIAPGLRMGWCQATPPIVQTLLSTRFDMGGSPLLQRTIHEYAVSGELDSHIEEIKEVYKGKRDLMLNELRESCADLASWRDPSGGFFVWLRLNEDIDPLAVHVAAEEEGVFYIGGRRFFPELASADAPPPSMGGLSAAQMHRSSRSDTPFIRLAFSHTAEDQIPEGIRRLARAIEKARR